MEVKYQNYHIAVADILRIARHKKIMSQKDLAATLGVSQSRISKIESGSAVSDLIFWSKYLGVTRLRFSLLLQAIDRHKETDE